MVDDATGRTNGINELEHAAAGGRQVFDDENTRAFRHMAFDLGVTAMALGGLADIDHRLLG